MKNHPSELFITSLILRGQGMNQIQETLQEYNLPGIPEGCEEYITGLEAKVLENQPENFEYFDPKYSSYLKDLNVYFLFHPDKVVTSCTKILDCAAAKRDLYVGILGRIPETDLAEHLTSMYELEVSGETVRAFRHYYFNVNRVGHDDWAKLMTEIPSADEEYYSSVFNGGATVAAYRLGKEQHVSIREVVQAAVTSLYVSLQEIRHWAASPTKIKVLADTVSALAKAHNVIVTADTELENVAHELKQFKLAKNETKPVALKTLSGGNHSGTGREKPNKPA